MCAKKFSNTDLDNSVEQYKVNTQNGIDELFSEKVDPTDDKLKLYKDAQKAIEKSKEEIAKNEEFLRLLEEEHPELFQDNKS